MIKVVQDGVVCYEIASMAPGPLNRSVKVPKNITLGISYNNLGGGSLKITGTSKLELKGMYITDPYGITICGYLGDVKVTTTVEAKTTTDPKTNKKSPLNNTLAYKTTLGQGKEETEEVIQQKASDTSSNTVLANTPSNAGVTVTESVYESVDSVIYTDDAFIDNVYSKGYSDEDYLKNIENGLRIQDIRGIMGVPHQLLPISDPRIDSPNGVGAAESLGRIYAESIIKNIPLLLMTPGLPQFMAGYNENQLSSILGNLGGQNTGASINDLFSAGTAGKYYTLQFAYVEYFHYVNAMLRAAAFFLEIENEEIDGKKLGTLNWLWQTASFNGAEIYSHGNLQSFLGPYAGCLAFYADAGTSVDDSFSNETTQSTLANGIDSLSDSGRELNFLVGNISAQAGLKLDKLFGTGNPQDIINNAKSTIDNILPTNNVISNILGKATTILAGGRIVFPEIWSDSSFSRSYSCSMKLISPAGDKMSVYLNILVPIYHLLGFTLPRQSEGTGQAYFSPFLVRAYYKSIFNVDMGIIPGLSITKGDEGEWTIDGLPTVANVNFEIKDLYSGLYMSKQESDVKNQNLMSNIQELDYIANSCGININDQEVWRTIRMYTILGFTSRTGDKFSDFLGTLAQGFNQKLNNLFGVFK